MHHGVEHTHADGPVDFFECLQKGAVCFVVDDDTAHEVADVQFFVVDAERAWQDESPFHDEVHFPSVRVEAEEPVVTAAESSFGHPHSRVTDGTDTDWLVQTTIQREGFSNLACKVHA